MKIGITGASGHVGYVTYKKFQQQKVDTKLLLRKPVDYLQNATTVLGGLEDENALRKFVADCDVIIHIAGVVWPAFGKNNEVQSVNFEGTKRLFNIAKAAGVQHFVFMSSIHSMICPHQHETFDESTRLQDNPKVAYDYSKACCERFLKEQQGIRITILNPTAIIGPGDVYVRGMNQMFHRAINNNLPMVTAGGFNIVDVRNVADAVVSAVKNKKEGKYLVAGKYFEMKTLAQKFGAVNQIKVTKKVMGFGAMKAIAWLSQPVSFFQKKPFALNRYAVETLQEGHKNISNRKLIEELNVQLLPIEQSLEDTYHWFTKKEFKL